MSQKIGSLGSYRIDYTLEMAGAEELSKGYCVVADKRYLINVDGLAQGFDGEAVWMLNNLTREYTLDNPKPNSRNLFDNPTKAFDFEEELFEVVKFESKSEQEWQLTLRPAEGVLDGIEYVVVGVDKKSLLPTMLGYDMAGAGIYIDIVGVEPIDSSVSEFRIEVPSDYEVIDFR